LTNGESAQTVRGGWIDFCGFSQIPLKCLNDPRIRFHCGSIQVIGMNTQATDIFCAPPVMVSGRLAPFSHIIFCTNGPCVIGDVTVDGVAMSRSFSLENITYVPEEDHLWSALVSVCVRARSRLNNENTRTRIVLYAEGQRHRYLRRPRPRRHLASGYSSNCLMSFYNFSSRSVGT